MNSTETQDNHKSIGDSRFWRKLLRRIDEGQKSGGAGCTPILGPHFNLASQLSLSPRELAGELYGEYCSYDEPHKSLEDWDHEPTLPRLAQYYATLDDELWPHEQVQSALNKVRLPDSVTVYDKLANLPLPLYITTYYDDLLYQAINRHEQRAGSVTLDFCRWKDTSYNPAAESTARADVNHPLVYHLYGIAKDPRSLVLTEHDFLDYMARVGGHPKDWLPPQIEEAFSTTYLLFLGYRLLDLDFLVLIRLLNGYIQRGLFKGNHISVQFVEDAETDHEQAEEYLKQYFEKLDIDVCVGTPVDFVNELHDRYWAMKS